jgi:hypothetical protein
MFLRSSLSLSLILWLLAAPLIVDHCATTCETTHSGADSTPACHHDTAQSAVVGGAPERCGHDHASAVAISAADPLRLVRSSLFSVVAIAAAPSDASSIIGQYHLDSYWSPPPPSRFAAAISPLRI